MAALANCATCWVLSCSVVQDWSEELFSELHNAGGSVFSNYAVGYNNVDVKAATKHGIAVGNTPGQGPCLRSVSLRENRCVKISSVQVA